MGRSPYGERGLKSRNSLNRKLNGGRSPYGERGLKFLIISNVLSHSRSLSLRRAWIEINHSMILKRYRQSLSLRRAWIEISMNQDQQHQVHRRSPYGERGLKFVVDVAHRREVYVALLTESVD